MIQSFAYLIERKINSYDRITEGLMSQLLKSLLHFTAPVSF